MVRSSFAVTELQEVFSANVDDLRGARTYRCTADSIPSPGCTDRLVLDFSDAPKLRPTELCRLLEKFLTDSACGDVEISIVGLKCRVESKGLSCKRAEHNGCVEIVTDEERANGVIHKTAE